MVMWLRAQTAHVETLQCWPLPHGVAVRIKELIYGECLQECLAQDMSRFVGRVHEMILSTAIIQPSFHWKVCLIWPSLSHLTQSGKSIFQKFLRRGNCPSCLVVRLR